MSSESSLEPTLYRWLDDVPASSPTNTTALKASPRNDGSSVPRLTKRPRLTDKDSGSGVMSNKQETPRPVKRCRDSNDMFCSSPTPSSRSDSTVSTSSNRRGRLSPVKQIQVLRDLKQPIIFCDFDSVDADSKQSDVTAMHTATQMLADGVGILEYDNADVFNASIAELPNLDRMRLHRPWAKAARRARYGSTPAIRDIANIVEDAIALNSDAGRAEDEWSLHVQMPLLKLALVTSRHANVLTLRSVRSSRIDPPDLNSTNLPGHIVDYVFCLNPDPIISNVYRTLQPLTVNTVKSWNHITRTARDLPFAIHIETKSPMKSWTDSKPRIGIWIDAWLQRCEVLWYDDRSLMTVMTKPWPAIPVLISQGHEWHLLIVTKTDEKVIVREQVMIGSTRNVYDALKIVSVLHWLLDWAETVWRPWFLELIAGEEG